MHRSRATLLAICLLVAAALTAATLTGCGPDKRAQIALTKGNAALAAYAIARYKLVDMLRRRAGRDDPCARTAQGNRGHGEDRGRRWRRPHEHLPDA